MAYLRLEGITKRFGNFIANDNITLSVSRGSIHAMLGENGAGKTTLMNIICGLYQPDAGDIYLEDKPIKINSANTAIAHGIGMIHQHFMLVSQLTVTENIILGTEFDLRLNLQAKSRAIAQMAHSYNLDIDTLAKVESLSIGLQQRVEIIKALYRNAKLLILDEPTAVLTPPEVEVLAGILRQLARDGHTIIFISHKLEEVMNICDTVTVLRRGQVVTTMKTADTSSQELAKLMVGREVLFQVHKSAFSCGDVVLEVKNLQVRDERNLPIVKDVSFQLRAGEILGIAGVDGNGQRELADAIALLRNIFGGSIQRYPSPGERGRGKSIAYIPEDRQKMGLVMGFSIAKNLILKAFNFLPFCRRWLLQYGIINNYAAEAMQNFDIRAENPSIKVSHLSGGNQQKVVLARELSGNPALIVAMQPTRGLDVGATEYVQQCLLAERQKGAAILYISTELEEVMAMSDRIAVMYEGQFVDILDADTATVEQIGYLMTGGKVSTGVIE
ncbi:ABC transporter ATP-binding protein [Aerosakkonema funiforme]|uniref:ABC transporter ATP-binding protein n=1 Tax=Aerosakkonema funiforme FACHB-1375 TaxID=2949571 RepID=A0A926VBQ5_9CYAN|nr:ATP-binding cassette domain-containing protein [Aerosakkonema funiforme]MBD2179639.1 ABC transporter ATP-binding protein [Aerosakkonema funiforme FACHB-1375]